MKNILSNRVLWFLLNWLRTRIASGTGGKTNLNPIKRHKKLSPKHEHLLKIASLFKNRLPKGEGARKKEYVLPTKH